jgi:hypothetical protein
LGHDVILHHSIGGGSSERPSGTLQANPFRIFLLLQDNFLQERAGLFSALKIFGPENFRAHNF